MKLRRSRDLLVRGSRQFRDRCQSAAGRGYLDLASRFPIEGAPIEKGGAEPGASRSRPGELARAATGHSPRRLRFGVLRETSQPDVPSLLSRPDCGSQKGYGLSCRPIDIARDATDFAAAGINQKGSRDMVQIEARESAAGFVDVKRQGGDAVAVEKVRRRRLAVAIFVERQHDQLGRINLLRQSSEGRHFTDAGRAPGRPEIEQEKMTTKRVEAHDAAVRVAECERRHLLRRIGLDEVACKCLARSGSKRLDRHKEEDAKKCKSEERRV